MGYRYRQTARRISRRVRIRYEALRLRAARGQRRVTGTRTLRRAGQPRRQVKVGDRRHAAARAIIPPATSCPKARPLRAYKIARRQLWLEKHWQKIHRQGLIVCSRRSATSRALSIRPTTDSTLPTVDRQICLRVHETLPCRVRREEVRAGASRGSYPATARQGAFPRRPSSRLSDEGS